MIEETVAITIPNKKTSKMERQAGIKTVIRYAVQIICDVGQGSDPSLKIIRKKMEIDEQGRSFHLDVENTGESLVRPKVSLQIFDSQGTPLRTFDTGLIRIYPTCSVRYRFNLSEFSPGKFVALVILDPGDSNLMGAQYALEITP